MGERTMISWCDHTFNIWWGSGKTVHLPILDRRRHDARPQTEPTP